MAAFNELLEVYAGDVRTIRLPIRADEVALLTLTEETAADFHVEFWLADKSLPTEEQIRVRLTQAEGVEIIEASGKWFVQVELLEEHTGALKAPFGYYVEARITDPDNERVLVTCAGTLQLHRSMIAHAILDGDFVPPSPAGSPTLALVVRAEAAAQSAEASEEASREHREYIEQQLPIIEGFKDAAEAAAGAAAASEGVAETKADDSAASAELSKGWASHTPGQDVPGAPAGSRSARHEASVAASNRAAGEQALADTIIARDLTFEARDLAEDHADAAAAERAAIELPLLQMATGMTAMAVRTMQIEQAQVVLAGAIASLAGQIIAND